MASKDNIDAMCVDQILASDESSEDEFFGFRDSEIEDSESENSDESESDINDEEVEVPNYLEEWTTYLTSQTNFIEFHGPTPGAKDIMDQSKTSLDFLNLIFIEDLYEFIAEETN